jgi:CRISPR-associated protein Cst2
MNMAKGLEPYRHNAVFTQSPLSAGDSAYKNSTTSALLHRETAVTAFQYPFALSLADCKPKADWAKALLKAIGELNDVAGNHARSYFEMAPASLIVRLTPQLVAGYQTYCFRADGKLPNVVEDILRGDCGYPGNEFYLGGEIVKRDLKPEQQEALKKAGVTLDPDPRRLLAAAADKFLGGK